MARSITHRDTAVLPSGGNYQGIFESSTDMIFVSSRDGQLLDLNPAGAALLGYGSREEALALGRTELLFFRSLHWEVFRREIERHGFVKDFDASFRANDGMRIHCLLSGTAVRLGEGGTEGYQGIARDVTARMDAVRSLQQKHRELSLLNAVAVAINAGHDLSEVLASALDQLLQLLRLDAGGIFLIEPGREDFRPAVEHGLAAGDRESGRKVAVHDDVLRRALFDPSVHFAPEPIFPPFHATLVGRDFAGSLRLTCFLIPSKGKAQGFLGLEIPPERRLADQDIHLLGSLCNFLGGAIENAQLMRSVREHREELRDLTARLFQSQEAERRRIALELHDEAGQTLTGVHFALETIERTIPSSPDRARELVTEVRGQINRTYQQIRDLSHSLHPALLNDMGLEPAIEALLARVAEHTRIEVDFRLVGFRARLSQDLENVLYRLAQEAVANVVKHARARHFRLSIVNGYPNLVFLAEDDGVGFDPEKLEEGEPTLGLLSLRERAATVGGTFSLKSSRGKGTRIRIEIPSEDKPVE